MRSVALLSSMILLPLVLLSPMAGQAKTKAVGPPDVAWKDMTYLQRRDYMKAAVMPKMKPIFQKFDPMAFSDFSCQTCHGKDASDRKYKMPSPDVRALPDTAEAFEAKLKTETTWPKWTKFMAGEVEPAMGALLNVPVFNPKQPVKGAFSCGACHRLEAAAR
jgi:hypothetical protein